MKNKFFDGLLSLTNDLINRRKATSTNVFESQRLDDGTLRALFIEGVFSKIYRIKTSYALNNTLNFESKEDQKVYEQRIKRAVKRAAQFQLGFGRGIIVINETGKDLEKPLSPNVDLEKVKLDVFSGDMISSPEVSRDLNNPRYYKPKFYIIRGYKFHWTRVIDFTYLQPVENELSKYQYGGVSLAQLIYNQLMNDMVIQRALPTIVEKSSSFFYKIKGFRNAVQQKAEDYVKESISTSEDFRGIYGAGIIDTEDSVEAVVQQLNGLKDIDDSSLRRLALVTGIPTSMLVGESVKGLNSSGEEERQVFNDANDEYQNDYLIDPIRQVCAVFGITGVSFKESGELTPMQQVAYEKSVLENAVLMQAIGEDFNSYIEGKGIIEKDTFMDLFKDDPEPEQDILPGAFPEQPEEKEPQGVQP